MFQIVMLVFGIIGLVKGGQFNITRNRQVRASGGRFLGGILIVGAILPILYLPALLIVIVLGLAFSEPTEGAAQQPGPPPQVVSRKTFYAVFLLLVGGAVLALGLSSNNSQTIIAGAVMALAGAALAVYSLMQGRAAG